MMRILCLLLLGVLVTGAPTTKPLEHSPSDLAWDAWLKQGHPPEGIPPRRITTKSLFIFPNLGTDSLPSCAEGYRPDSMGRCVKVVKVNESAHLEFLLQKLNSQFATESGSGSDESYDYEIDTETDNTGPFQINIPLAQVGHKVEDNKPGEYVYVSKKDTQHQPEEHTQKAPTSAPEVVPDIPETSSQFFPGGPLAETQGVLSTSGSNDKGGVSLHTGSSTNTADSGVKATEGDDKVKEEVKETNKDEESKEPVTEHEDIHTTQPVGGVETSAEDDSHKRYQTNSKLPSVILDPLVEKTDELIKEIESLKMQPEVIEPHHSHHNIHNTQSNEKINRDFLDIEEKIKLISKYADVSRNTENYKNYNFQFKKRPSSNLVRFPEETVDYNYGKPTDLFPVANTPIQLPFNHQGMPIPHNSVYNINPVDSYEKFPPIYYDKSNEKYKPYYLPYGWNVHNTHSGEHNLMDFWSKISMAQRYPYNVRFNREQPPTSFPSLYPSSRETGNRLNVRHAAVNYRQGRDNVVRKRKLYEDDSVYKRSVHPHFRDTGHSLAAYHGR